MPRRQKKIGGSNQDYKGYCYDSESKAELCHDDIIQGQKYLKVCAEGDDAFLKCYCKLYTRTLYAELIIEKQKQKQKQNQVTSEEKKQLATKVQEQFNVFKNVFYPVFLRLIQQSELIKKVDIEKNQLESLLSMSLTDKFDMLIKLLPPDVKTEILQNLQKSDVKTEILQNLQKSDDNQSENTTSMPSGEPKTPQKPDDNQSENTTSMPSGEPQDIIQFTKRALTNLQGTPENRALNYFINQLISNSRCHKELTALVDPINKPDREQEGGDGGISFGLLAILGYFVVIGLIVVFSRTVGKNKSEKDNPRGGSRPKRRKSAKKKSKKNTKKRHKRRSTKRNMLSKRRRFTKGKKLK